jgi:hypothetical protein
MYKYPQSLTFVVATWLLGFLFAYAVESLLFATKGVYVLRFFYGAYIGCCMIWFIEVFSHKLNIDLWGKESRKENEKIKVELYKKMKDATNAECDEIILKIQKLK